MGQQQLLLLVLGIVIVGLAVVVGIQAFGENQKKANSDAPANAGVRSAPTPQPGRSSRPPLAAAAATPRKPPLPASPSRLSATAPTRTATTRISMVSGPSAVSLARLSS